MRKKLRLAGAALLLLLLLGGVLGCAFLPTTKVEGATPERNAVISLNKGEVVYTFEGGMARVPLLIEGHGDKVRIEILYEPNQIWFAGAYPACGEWTLECLEVQVGTSGQGKIFAIFSAPSRVSEGGISLVADLWFWLPRGRSFLQVGEVEILSQGRNVSVLLMLGTEVIRY